MDRMTGLPEWLSNWKEWLQLWAIFYLLPALAAALIFWRGSLKSYKWNIWDVAQFVLPFLLWLTLYLLELRDKAVQNYFEVLILSGALFCTLSLRVILHRFSKGKGQALFLLILLCAAAIALYYKGFTLPRNRRNIFRSTNATSAVVVLAEQRPDCPLPGPL
ncbi:MAG TPA: hypothetical protein PKW76_01145 [bacterium]|nr:hypothetical protein [bacterium]HPG44259.1 hypothetical protein [bacterium]HPM96626.1 hypothetical protein [bacterium]